MKSNQYIQARGRLTGSPTIKESEAGKPYLKASMACNRKDKNKEGKEEEVTTYYNLLCFGPQAEIYEGLEKGQYIYVEGNLQVRPYTSKENVPKVDLTILVEDLHPVTYVDAKDKKEEK